MESEIGRKWLFDVNFVICEGKWLGLDIGCEKWILGRLDF